jgi:Mrp family chromosome partitioning ATPase
VGEISDALRRARHHRGDAADKRKGQAPLPAPDAVTRRVERRDDGRESGPVGSSVGETFESRRLSLPTEREGEWRARAVVVDGGSAATESFRHLALKMRAELERRSLRCVAVTGPLRSEGKTTVACNLALALASVSRGREVALVDLDLRHPSVAASFGIPVETGVEECILEAQPLSEVCVSITKPAVDVFPAAGPHDSAHELLVQPGFAALVRELERRYSTVIFDTPPVLLVPDASLILDRVSAFVALARSGATRKRALRSMLELLPRDRLLGTLLNEGPLPADRRQYRYYAGEPSTPADEE